MADEHHHDPTFYRSPRDAAAAPAEKIAYLATFSRPATSPDALAVVDVDPESASYASVIGFTELPNTGDELHHFGWNACSSALCPTGDHKHGDRRYLIVPGLRSSNLYVFDTLDNPAEPKIVKALGAEELGKRPVIRARTPCTAARAPCSCRAWAATARRGRAGSRCWTTPRSR